MNQPLCSIIIPAYNHGKYIERSITSALNQTYPNKEIIVVDDGSTDDTAERVKKFGDAITYIRKKNTGRGNNRNVGILASKGKYIQFLDADDYISENKLELQVPVLEENEKFAAVYCDCTCTTPDGKIFENVCYPLKDNEDPIQMFIDRNLFAIHAVLIKRSVVIEVGMFDEENLAQEDWDLWFQVALKGYKYKYVSGNLAYYDQAGSATVTNIELMYKRTRHMLEKYKADPEFCKVGQPLVNNFFAHRSHALSNWAYNFKWWAESRKYFWKVVKFNKSLMTSSDWACLFKTYFFQVSDFLRGKKSKNAPV